MPPQYLQFAEAILQDVPKAQAYRQIRPNVTIGSSGRLGYWLANHPQVQKYVKAVRVRQSGKTVMSAIERRERLAEAARDPENTPDQVITRTDPEGNTSVEKRSMSVAKALELDAKLAGDLNDSPQTAVLLNLGGGAAEAIGTEIDQAVDAFDGWGHTGTGDTPLVDGTCGHEPDTADSPGE